MHDLEGKFDRNQDRGPSEVIGYEVIGYEVIGYGRHVLLLGFPIDDQSDKRRGETWILGN